MGSPAGVLITVGAAVVFSYDVGDAGRRNLAAAQPV